MVRISLTSPRSYATLAISASMALTAGCGTSRDPELSLVHGIVEFNGQPLAGARVEFNPLRSTGTAARRDLASSGSFAITDEDGYYELAYGAGRAGAVPGEHSVRISTRNVEPDNPYSWQERIPAIYNVASQLKYKVIDGENVANFTLHSTEVANQ